MKLNVTVMDGVEIKNSPEDEVSEIDVTLLSTEGLLSGLRVVEEMKEVEEDSCVSCDVPVR